jgi:hypothetical protein
MKSPPNVDIVVGPKSQMSTKSYACASGKGVLPPLFIPVACTYNIVDIWIDRQQCRHFNARHPQMGDDNLERAWCAKCHRSVERVDREVGQCQRCNAEWLHRLGQTILVQSLPPYRALRFARSAEEYEKLLIRSRRRRLPDPVLTVKSHRGPRRISRKRIAYEIRIPRTYEIRIPLRIPA